MRSSCVSSSKYYVEIVWIFNFTFVAYFVDGSRYVFCDCDEKLERDVK